MKYKVTKLFTEFFKNEQASGIVLLFSVGLAMLLTNSPLGENFLGFWHIEVGWDLGPHDHFPRFPRHPKERDYFFQDLVIQILIKFIWLRHLRAFLEGP